MPDMEKVIKGLSCCAKWMDENDIDACNSCPYHSELSDKCIGTVDNEAIALLKEQATEIERLKKPDCEHAMHDGAGCLGYSGCKQDDEPIEACQLCEQYTGNRA